MRINYVKYMVALTILFNIRAFAQVPYEWNIIDSELTHRFDSVETIIKAKWSGGNYCTDFAGSLLTASTNRGYYLFTPHPPGGLDVAYQNKLLKQVDSMLIMMDTLGYKAVDMDICYPTLVDSFPNFQLYLDFQKKVFAMAHSLGFKTIVNCHASILFAAEPYLLHDIDSFYFYPHGVPDTLNRQRFLSTKLQMLQTIIDTLAPDYLTVLMEPNTEFANLYGLLSFSVDSSLYYVNYFLSHLNKKTTLLGAGAGTWNVINYFEKFAATNIDYLDYHVYPVAGTCLKPMVFQVDSIAQANAKKIVVGECWSHKTSDSEWAANNSLNYWRDTFYIRDDFSYFEHLDTMFTQIMINLSQQAHIDLVDFFATEYEFGYLNWGPKYYSMSGSEINNIDDSIDYINMYNMQLGPLGAFTKKAIGQINCITTGINNPELPPGISIYPNPANTQLMVILNQHVQEIEIDNVLGQCITKVKVYNNPNSEVIDVTGLSPGIYFIRFLTSNGYVVKKFVKKREGL